MKILITTGIYPPDIGGPATYAHKMAEKLIENGDEVAIVTFSNKVEEAEDTLPEEATPKESRRGNPGTTALRAGYGAGTSLPARRPARQSIGAGGSFGAGRLREKSPLNAGRRLFRVVRVVRGNRILNRIRFFFAVYRLATDYDIIYTLDWFAAGLPVALAANLRRKPYVVRVGGDYLWEQRYLESGEPPIPLADFYALDIYKRKEYALFYRIIRFVLRGAERVIFNSDKQRELYIGYYGLSDVRSSTINNPVPRAQYKKISRGKPSNEFIYWGRFIVMKNLTALIRAFAAAKLPSGYSLTIIGDGPRKKELEDLVKERGVSNRVKILPPLPLSNVLERGKNSRAFVLPSWTDISPNQVYECIAIGLPVLITRENYLSVKNQFPGMIDPNSVTDISKKLEMLSDDAFYKEFSRRFNSISIDNDWDNVLKEHMRVFEKVRAPLGHRVLQIGSDRTILDRESPSAARMRAYGRQFGLPAQAGTLDMIIFSGRRREKKIELAPGVTAYATNSWSRFSYILGAIYMGLKIPRPDCISVQDPFEAGLAGYFISIVRGVPLHVQVHTDFLSAEFIRLSILNRVRLFLARIVLLRAKRIRVVSERVKKSVERKYHPRATITVLPIFIDIERYRKAEILPALAARDKLFDHKFLVVSRLEPEKNVKLAIDAFARAAIEKSCLIIIGDGNELEKLHELAEKKGVAKWVFFEGYTDPAPYYKVADLVLFPSLYDGYGMVIVEALAAGTPVLATDVGIAREAGAIIAPSERFSEALKNWVKNGPREGHLKNYPYRDFDEYARAYSNDILACIGKK